MSNISRQAPGTIIAGQKVGGQFAPTPRTEPEFQDTSGQAEEVRLADDSTQEVQHGVWSPESATIFQEGQCVAFAVAYAERVPGSVVRTYWREDGELEHAVVYDPVSRTVTDSIESLPAAQWDANWRYHHDGDFVDYDEYPPEELKELLKQSGHGFDMLPEQNFGYASSVMDALPDHLRPSHR